MDAMRTTGCCVAAALLLGLNLAPPRAQAGEDFESYRRAQQTGVQQMQKEFQDYQARQNREFADFLKTQWRDSAAIEGRPRFTTPEPKHAPVFQPPPGTPPPPAAPQAVRPPPPPQPLPPPRSRAFADDTMEVAFYGNPVRFTYDPRWASYRLPGGDKPQAMSAFWTMMSDSDYGPAMQTVNAARRDLHLDDWGAVILWRSIAQALQPGRPSEQNLLLWYFLVNFGYDARMGYAGEDVYLFVAIRQHVYATQYIRVGDQQYYAALTADHGAGMRSVYTYEASYPGNLRPLDVQAATTAFTRPLVAHRELAFSFRGKAIRLDVPYDRRLAEYLGTFPQTDFELYFDTGASTVLRRGLVPELKRYTAGMSQEEAVDFLLAFVQYAFAYKTDIEQFGYQKSFFVEESLYFPYADCKDRSVLFAWLVREVLGIKAVALHYPGHMTTALALRRIQPDFTTIAHDGQRYVIADPTYIGASVGEAMPSYQNTAPIRVIDIP